MPVTYGFFNSKNGDRTYNAEEMGSLFGGIITDGIFANYPNTGEQLVVAPAGGMRVKVGPGRGWFHNTWINNDTILELGNNMFDCPGSSAVYRRIDAIFIKIDTSNEGRCNSFEFASGEFGEDPWAEGYYPTKANSDGIFYYRLADILIEANLTEITANLIINYLGLSADLPVITAPLEHVSAEGVLVGWKEEVDGVVATEVNAALNDPSSVISGYLKTVPSVWLLSDAVPTSFVPGSPYFPLWAYQEYTNDSGEQFYPDFTTEAIGSHNVPKVGDIVIGTNGYYSTVTSATISGSTYDIVVRGTGHNLHETFKDDVTNIVLPFVQKQPMTWICDKNMPTVPMMISTLSNEICKLYPDFLKANADYNTPKEYDIVIGANGYYATVMSVSLTSSSFSIVVSGTGHNLHETFKDDVTNIVRPIVQKQPMIWICDKNMPTVPMTTSALSNRICKLYPDFSTNPTIRENNVPKVGDIVIGTNGYYSTVTSATIRGSTYDIVVSGTGHNLHETFKDDVAAFNKQLNTTVWMCSREVPATTGQIVTYMKNTSGGIPAQATFYPDFSTNPTIRENNAPKVGDCVLGANGYYGIITNAIVTGSYYFSITIAGTGEGLTSVGVDESTKVLEITFSGIDPYDTNNSGTWHYPDVSMYPSWPEIREAYNDGYTLVAKILVSASRYQSGGASGDEDIYAYVPITKTLWDGHLAGIEVHTINYWGQTYNIDAIHYKWTTDDTLIGWYDHLYNSAAITPVIASIPNTCEVDSETGVVTFKNSNGAVLFTFQLPLYTGTIEDNDT